MKVLIVAATEPEIKSLIPYFNKSENFSYLITGIGMVATTYALTNKLNKEKYDLILNIGIAGSFNKEYMLGEVVNVMSDRISELGVEDNEQFMPMHYLKIFSEDRKVSVKGLIANTGKIKLKNIESLKKVNGITVNRVHGNKKSINEIIDIYNPDIETMEGAAFMYVCKKEKIPFYQIRSISNYVEERNLSNWNIPLALENLNKGIFSLLKEINSKNPKS